MKKSQFRKGDGEMYEIIWLAALVILLIAEALTCGLTVNAPLSCHDLALSY